jgi:hypothetical protein
VSFQRCFILCVLLAFAGQLVASLNFPQKSLQEWSELDDASDESEEIFICINQSSVMGYESRRSEAELCSPIENPPEGELFRS